MQTRLIYLKLVDPSDKNAPTYSWHITWDAALFLQNISDRYRSEKDPMNKRYVSEITELQYYQARWPDRHKAA